ncbi:MAG: 16S rRNA (cytosine(1402)-N(4))-methyltransferase RsmH [Polyangiaceae bacterium]
MAELFEQRLDYQHVTVMASEVVRSLRTERGGLFIDVTAGGGGHSAAILESNADCRIIAFDRDPEAVLAASARLSSFGERARVVRASFDEIEAYLSDRVAEPVAGLVADLGVSSHQLDDPERGMSFRSEGPLDMRMDPEHGETARELIARVSQDQLADLIYAYGEERRSRRVARCIKQALEKDELDSTLDLRRAVVRAVGPRRVGGIDPATRTFQALRIAVNGELDQLERLLAFAASRLPPGAMAAFISFHSLEDRMVKRALRARDVWLPSTKKPELASPLEQAENPRARSAKLRAAERVTAEEAPR